MRKRKAYICSPLSAVTTEEMRNNMAAARWYMRVVSEKMDCRAVAPHAYLPEFLDDHDEAERNLALNFGLAYLDTCDMLVICGTRITQGMLGEIMHASKRGIPIFWMKEAPSPRFGRVDYQKMIRW